MTTTCPPSAVLDQIVHWFQVCEGDLVAFDGRWFQLVKMWPTLSKPPYDLGVRLLREGMEQDFLLDSNSLVGVRRYETEPDRWAELKAYLDANAKDSAAEAAAHDHPVLGNDGIGRRLRARGETFALVRQYMDEMEAAPRCSTCRDTGKVEVPDPDGLGASDQACPEPGCTTPFLAGGDPGAEDPF